MADCSAAEAIELAVACSWLDAAATPLTMSPTVRSNLAASVVSVSVCWRAILALALDFGQPAQLLGGGLVALLADAVELGGRLLDHGQVARHRADLVSRSSCGTWTSRLPSASSRIAAQTSSSGWTRSVLHEADRQCADHRHDHRDHRHRHEQPSTRRRCR
jgi:hypothetical protein